MTSGIILAKIGIISVSPILGTFIRLFWGVIGLVLWGLMTKLLGTWINPLKNFKLLKKVFVVVFLSIFGGFLLSLAALKYIDASIASILNATTPIFILPLVIYFFKERISLKAFLGALIGVLGVSMILLGK
jgi:drug/metabolite transporter (DMT)-like permease